MCWFITLILPAAEIEDVRAHINRMQANDGCKMERWMLMPHSNEELSSIIPAGLDQQWLVRGDEDGACSCGMYCDPRILDEDPPWRERKLDGLRKKGMRRGWSESKIERAVSQAADANPPQEAFYGMHPDVRRLIADLTAIAGKVGVFVRWLSGRSEDDRIPKVGTRYSGVSRLLTDQNLIRPGELVWLKPER